MWERSCIPPSPPPFPPWLIFFPLRMPRRHVLPIVPCSCCPHSLRSINNVITVVDNGLCYPLTTTSSALCTIRCPPPSPVFFPQKTQVCPGNPANRCSSLKKLKPVLAPLPSQLSFSCGPALLCLVGAPCMGNLPDGVRNEGKQRRTLWWRCFSVIGFCNEVLIPLWQDQNCCVFW